MKRARKDYDVALKHKLLAERYVLNEIDFAQSNSRIEQDARLKKKLVEKELDEAEKKLVIKL